MKTITRDEFSPSIVVKELMDGAGAIILKNVFSKDRIEKICQTLETEFIFAGILGELVQQHLHCPVAHKLREDDPLLVRQDVIAGPF